MKSLLRHHLLFSALLVNLLHDGRAVEPARKFFADLSFACGAAADERYDVRRVYCGDNQSLQINRRCLAALVNEFPLIHGHLGGEFLNVLPVVTATGKEIINDGESPINNGGAAAADKGGHDDISWHDLILAVVAFVFAFLLMTLLLALAVWIIRGAWIASEKEAA